MMISSIISGVTIVITATVRVPCVILWIIDWREFYHEFVLLDGLNNGIEVS